MAKIRRNTKREMPALNTSSLPDIIFMLLFFFMSVTSMKEVSYKVDIKKLPSATELTKLEKKSLIRYMYIGKELGKEKDPFAVSRIQLDDQFAEVSDVYHHFSQELLDMPENDRAKMTVSIKAHQDTKMGIITDVKQELRKANALKISYASLEAQPNQR